MFYFIWLNILSVGIVDFFLLELHGKYATLTRHLNFHFAVCNPISKLQTFPMLKSKTIIFLLDRIQQHTPVLFRKISHELLLEKELLSGHCPAYFGVAAMRCTTCYT